VLVEQALGAWLTLAFLLNRWPVRLHGTVRADEHGLALRDKLVVERTAITTAFVIPAAEPIVRIVTRHGGPFDVALETEDAANDLLGALQLGVGQSVATFGAFQGRRTSYLTVVAAAALSPAVLGVGAGSLLHLMSAFSLPRFLAWTGIVAAPLLLLLRPMVRVGIGSDGILLRRILGGRRFVSYATMTGVSLQAGTIVLDLASGRRVWLSAALSHGRQGGEALVARIEKAREAFVRGEGSDSAEALVAPGGRPVDRWLREVRGMSKARDYREARTDVDRLWSLLFDSTTSPATRAGAAIALPHDEASRARLRVAADACAEPRLRVALTRVADGAPDAALEEALAPLLEAEG
jgi:hypothetical protein